MINLFFVIHDYSGVRTYANELLAYLSEIDGICLHVIFYESKCHKEYKLIRDGNTTEIHLPTIKTLNYRLDKYAARCLDLMQTLLQGKNNIVFHLNDPRHVKLGVKARERFDAKIIYTLHFLPDYFSYYGYDDDWCDNLKAIGGGLEREMVDVADHIICVTHFAKKVICRYYETLTSKVTTIHNGFSRFTDETVNSGESETTIKEAFGFGANEQIILFVGFLEHRKGINCLIRSFNHLSNNNRDFRLVVVGDGNFKLALENVNGYWGKITFTGKVSFDEVSKFYRIATVGVIPSVYEQCSYVALEMMKHGLPVVVTAAPGLRELYIDGENSLVVPLHKTDNDHKELVLNEDELTAALATVLNDEVLREKLSRNARAKWEQFYTANQMGSTTYLLYRYINELKDKKLINIFND
jgi:glycosyltransferase involved in cell wall biosynthesis